MRPIIIILIGIMSIYTFESFINSDNHKSINYGTQSVKLEKDQFHIFLKTFSSDSIFQVNHINFPLKYVSVDIEDNIEEILILPENWEIVNLNNNYETVNRKIDAYQQLIEIENDTAKVLFRGIDNGIYMDFLFTKKNGTWFLIEWNNNSV